jgi:4-hydroxy-2-oxoglutarate aldolase
MNSQQILHRIEGVFPPAVTPFTAADEIDEAAFRSNLQRYAGTGLGGVLVTGSTGEAPYLAEAERLRLVEIAREVVQPPELLLVGTGLESTRETIRLSREVIRRGADALLVVTPNYYKPRMDAPAMIGHYTAVADALARPVLIYSIPQFTGVDIAVDTIAALSEHGNIVGLKESSGKLDFVLRVLGGVKRGFRVLCGSAAILLPALDAGAAGAVLAQACFAPELCVSLYQAFREARIDEARRLQDRLDPLALNLTVPYGIPGIKAALDIAGYVGGSPRSPLRPLDSEEHHRIKAIVEAALPVHK